MSQDTHSLERGHHAQAPWSRLFDSSQVRFSTACLHWRQSAPERYYFCKLLLILTAYSQTLRNQWIRPYFQFVWPSFGSRAAWLGRLRAQWRVVPSHRHHDVNKNKAGGVAHAHDHTYAGMINVPAVHSAQQTHQEHVEHDHAYIQKHTAQENTLADHTYVQLHQKIAKKHVKKITPLLKQMTSPCPQTTQNNKRLHSATIETTTDANNNCETNHQAKKLCQHKVPQPNYFISIQSNEFAAYNVPGDGDCFFHCMTLATHHILHESAHIHYRESICSHIYHNWENFLHLLPSFHDTSMTKQWYMAWPWLRHSIRDWCGCWSLKCQYHCLLTGPHKPKWPPGNHIPSTVFQHSSPWF